jgi:Fur family ferric uptake transcriptional regulator
MGHKENVEKLRDELKKQNRNYTPEREELLKVISSMDGIYSLEDLYRKAFKKKTIHAKSTIYRTIDIYLNAGFIEEAKSSARRKRYQTNHKAFK